MKNKKLLTFLSALFVAGGMIGGASLIAANTSAKEASAEISTSVSIGTALKFANTSSDTNSVPYSSMTSGGWGNSSASVSSRMVTITEDTPSKYFGCVYVPISYQVTIPAYTSYSEAFNAQLLVKKEATGGSAGFYGEVFNYGTTNTQPTAFNTAANTTSSDSTYSIKRLAGTSAGTLQQYNISFTLLMNNLSGSEIVKTFYFGFFAGIRYASSYDHQLTASFNFYQTTVTETVYQAIVGSTPYQSLFDAVSAFNAESGLSLKLCRSISYNGGFTLSTTGNIIFNGFTLTINSSYSLDITGAITTSGTGTLSAKLTIKSGGSLNVGAGGIITSPLTTVMVNSGGTLTNLGTIKTTGTLSGYWAIINSGTAYFGTCSVSASNNQSISCTAGSKTYFYASASISGIINSVGSTSLIYGSYNSAYYTGSGTINIASTGYSVGDTVVTALSSGYFSKFVLSQAGLTTTLSSSNAVASYASYNVTINGSHFTHDSVSTVSMAIQYTVTLTPDTGYQIAGKSQIDMTIGGAAYTGFTYTPSTGFLYLAASNVTGNIVITVTPTIKTYTLRYIANNGTTTCSETDENHGSTIYVSENPFTYSGYEFLHWNTESDDSGTSYVADDTFVITGITFLYAIWVEEGAPTAVATFISNYMHMDDANYSGSGTGLCITAGTYSAAKTAFNALTSAARELFVSDSTYQSAKDRLVAWATANGEELNASNTLVTSSSNHIGLANQSNTEMYVTLLLITLLGVGFVVFCTLKKKKRA